MHNSPRLWNCWTCNVFGGNTANIGTTQIAYPQMNCYFGCFIGCCKWFGIKLLLNVIYFLEHMKAILKPCFFVLSSKHVILTCSVQWFCAKQPESSSFRVPRCRSWLLPPAWCPHSKERALVSPPAGSWIGSLVVILVPKANQECESPERQGSRGLFWIKRGLRNVLRGAPTHRFFYFHS